VQPSAGIDQLATDRRGTSTPLDYAQRDGNRVARSRVDREREQQRRRRMSRNGRPQASSSERKPTDESEDRRRGGGF